MPNYPSDWPCDRCYHSLSSHNWDFNNLPHDRESSSECRECAEAPYVFGKRIFCYEYKPTDNLTYVELKANGKLPR